jgi:hypothetical protein
MNFGVFTQGVTWHLSHQKQVFEQQWVLGAIFSSKGEKKTDKNPPKKKLLNLK